MVNNIKNWNVDPNKNDAESPYGWKEDMAPSDVNNTARQEMADIKDAYISQPWFSVGNPTISFNDMSSSDTSVIVGEDAGNYYSKYFVITIQDDNVDTNYAKYFTENRRVRATRTSDGKVYTTSVRSATYNPDTGVSTITTFGISSKDFGTIILGAAEVFTNLEIGLDPSALPYGINFLGCVLPYTADSRDLPFGFGLADGKTFNPDLYVDLAKLYTTSGMTPGGENTTYKYGQEYNAAAGKNWPKKPDVRGYFPRFLDSGKGIDPDSNRKVGSVQKEGTSADDLFVRISEEDGNWKGAAAKMAYLAGRIPVTSGDRREMWHTAEPGVKFVENTTTVGSHDNETRPVNIAFPGILVMYGGYGSGSLISPDDMQSIVEANVTQYIDNKWVAISEATTDTKGIIRLATEEEVAEGLESQAALTPYNVQTVLVPLRDKVNNTYTKDEVDAKIGGAAATETKTVIVNLADWNQDTLSVKLDDYPDAGDVFWVSPYSSREQIELYGDAGCFAARDESTATLDLYCDTIPEENLVVEVVHMKIA